MRDHQIFDPDIETRPIDQQFQLDRDAYRKQIRYLMENSEFYQEKLANAGFDTPEKIGELDDISALPFTEKDEIRSSQANHPPFGNHVAADPDSLVRVFSTSGTTGTPCYLGLTRGDLDMYATNVARGYSAAGFKKGQRLVVGFNAGPFVAGAVYYGFDKIGCNVIPVGTGNTERMVTAIQKLGATGVSCTPSYGLYLIDWCRDHGIDTQSLGLQNMITAGEPGGGDPLVRRTITEAFGCTLRESMGIGDISLSVWAEDAAEDGMNFMARGFVHVELIDPASGNPIAWEDGAEGELVYTALQRESMPMLRFRSRDHVVVNMQDNPTGRTGPRIRCVGRTDDMLIVRGVNLFPTAVRSVLESFENEVSGIFSIRPKTHGVLQTPPLPLLVEVAHGTATDNAELTKKIKDEIKARLLVTSDVRLVEHGSLPRETYKTKLVDYSEAAA
ncbi:phenylacetyl-CoA ligase, putative [Luminiphilus syltensis NOR5-1B]|uniref:Phenylacetyl-CoA ligase, putative n=1 Tax=Luminiphilus syltensis NOR5-1B TaxID=565045 RepID=B8KSG2_9GAMM|nr:AMP-binding protein [Luminiphilus syltensis]EED35673.1 phenylacetyl-CoA ligase, putative [Luminiphilus syltensis NOR5-1B]